MEKRKMENIGAEPSMLGFGCMRFPTLEDGSINEAEGEKMLNYALDHGVTYVDTAYFYHDGASEPFVGKVLEKTGQKLFLSGNQTACLDTERRGGRQKGMYGTAFPPADRLCGFYLLHALNRERWEKLVEQGALLYWNSCGKKARSATIMISLSMTDTKCLRKFCSTGNGISARFS